MPDLRHGWRVHGRAQRLPGKIAVYYTPHILQITTFSIQAVIYFFGKMRRQNENRSYFDAAMHNALLSEKLRTGLGAIAVFKSITSPPPELTASTIEHWLSGSPKTVNAEHLELVINAWRALPNNAPTRRRPLKTSTGRIEVSEEMRAQLRHIHENAPPRYMRAAPKGFTATKLSHVLSGRDRTIPTSVWLFMLSHERHG